MSSTLVEKEYNKALDNYKKIVVFILKNKLPKNIACFNSIGGATYDLPPIKEFEDSKSKSVTIYNDINKIRNGGDTGLLVECLSNQCLKIVVDKQEILTKISKDKIWGYGKMATIPIKKTLK